MMTLRQLTRSLFPSLCPFWQKFWMGMALVVVTGSIMLAILLIT